MKVMYLARSALVALMLGAVVSIPEAAESRTPYLRGVPYFSQRQNSVNPSGSCQNTCMAMVLKYYGAEDITPDQISRRWGTSRAQTVTGWQDVFNTEAAERGLAVRDQGVSDGRMSAIHRRLDEGMPVAVHGAFTSSGHLMVLLGYDADSYYVHDPYGDWSTGYREEWGRHVRLVQEDVVRAVRGISNGWVRFHALQLEPGLARVGVGDGLPDSVLAGAEVELDFSLGWVGLPPRQVPGLVADLSALGGPPDLPLSAAGDDAYRLSARFGATPSPGLRDIAVAATDPSGDDWVSPTWRATVAVLPPEDDVLVADGLGAEWQLGPTYGFDIAFSQTQVHEGDSSMAITASKFSLTYTRHTPLDPHGYDALHFAFHPGDAVAGRKGAFRVYVNEDTRTFVDLLMPDADVPGVDVERREWQIVDVPMRLFAWMEEPIESIHFLGSFEGTFFLDDMRLAAARPCPFDASWVQALPDSVAAGQSLELSLAIRVTDEGEGTVRPTVTVDLTDLGGARDLPMVADGEVYRLSANVPIGAAHGRRSASVLIEQEVGERSYAMRLDGDVVVVPAADLVIYDDALGESWQQGYTHSVELRPEETGPVYEGEASLALTADYFTVELETEVPADPVGFRSLRLAFHPGDAVSRGTGSFNVSVNGDSRTSVLLMGGASAGPAIDLERPEWQVVEIPLAAFGGFDGPIESIGLLGDLSGTFYLDDLRLVAARVPEPAETVVQAEAGPGPQAFSLFPSFPNPFNSATTVPFSLSRSGSVELALHNLAGQKIRTLVTGHLPAGRYVVRWDGRSDDGRMVATGTYLSRLRAGDEVLVGKLLLIR